MNMLSQFLTSGGWLVPAGVFGVILFGAWALLSIMADRDERPLARLKRLSSGWRHAGGAAESSVLRKNDRVQEILALAAPALSRPLMPKSEYEQSQLKMRLATAGWRSESAVSVYLGLK